MSNTAAKKWAAARTLHEGWQAPLELLNRVLGHQPGAAERRCIAENWKSITSVARLRERLIEVFESQLDQFGSAGGELDLEKSSRAISVLAKTLEIIVASDALTENLGGAEQRASSPATHRKAKIVSAKSLGVSASAISQNLRGISRSCLGFNFNYI